jgi:acetyl esterase/lipase
LRVTTKSVWRPGLDILQVREHTAKMESRLVRRAPSVATEKATVAGVPATWFGAPELAQRGTLLYLHGGAWCLHLPAIYARFAAQLSQLTGLRILLPEYRLAPEHPFPAAVDDAVAAYRGLLAAGTDSNDIVVAGDSAGGGLSVATTLRLRELASPLPRALVLFSPWVDLTLEQAGPPPPGEIMLNLPWVRECARAYVASHDCRDPLLSPLEADLGGLPPTLIQVGTDELLLADSRRLHERLRTAGVTVRCEEYQARWHVFQANAGLLLDADRALESVARFVRAAAGQATGSRSTPASVG